jgi:hypothetical protein
MGLLDDAIREHLDLKRRRGADPAEIERAEREALGPARRSSEPAEGMTLVHDEPVSIGEPEGWDDAPSAAPTIEGPWTAPDPVPMPESAASLEDDDSFDDDDEHDFEEDFDENDEYADDDYREDDELDLDSSVRGVPEFGSATADRPDVGDGPPIAASSSPSDSTDPPGDPLAPASSDVPPPLGPPSLSEHLLGETIEYDVEEAFSDPAPAGADDVLEETPEFLQDTPDHDRLWFEQRPPRDFDFDG